MPPKTGHERNDYYDPNSIMTNIQKNVNGYFLQRVAYQKMNKINHQSIVTMSNKRKGTATMASSSFSVSVTPYDSDEEWLDTRQKLKELRTFSVDNLLSSFNSCISLQQDLHQEQTDNRTSLSRN